MVRAVNLLWVVASPDTAQWSELMLNHKGFQCKKEREQRSVDVNQPAHLQRGVTSTVVRKMLEGKQPALQPGQKAALVGALIAQHGTVSVHFALALMLVLGMTSSTGLRSLYGFPAECDAGRGYVTKAFPQESKILFAVRFIFLTLCIQR